METLDDLDPEHVASISRDALRLMAELGIPSLPENYNVWFAYVLGRSSALRKTIDVIRSNRRSFDKALNRELYDTFVRSDGAARDDQRISDELETILSNVRTDLATAIDGNKVQTQSLDSIEAGIHAEGIPVVIGKLRHELRSANARASTLQSKLTEASSELDQLRIDLQQAEKTSKTDALTGLANRRALEDFLRSGMIASMEQGEPLSVFLVDIDHFKTFNDKFGHQLGDQVLRLVARCLQEGVRSDDLPARFGGEELMCVMPKTPLGTCLAVAERIRSRIADARLTKRATGEHVGQVTVSVGVTEFIPGENFESLFERCDKALYQAKQDGRNRTVTA